MKPKYHILKDPSRFLFTQLLKNTDRITLVYVFNMGIRLMDTFITLTMKDDEV